MFPPFIFFALYHTPNRATYLIMENKTAQSGNAKKGNVPESGRPGTDPASRRYLREPPAVGRIADFADRMRRNRPRLEAMSQSSRLLGHKRKTSEHLPRPDLHNPLQKQPLGDRPRRECGDRPRFEGLVPWGQTPPRVGTDPVSRFFKPQELLFSQNICQFPRPLSQTLTHYQKKSNIPLAHGSQLCKRQ